MPPDRWFLLAAVAVFLAAVRPALRSLKSGNWTVQRQWPLMLLGLALQSTALWLRGRELGQCPMKSLSDVLVFVAWSVVLLYALVGSGFRLSLLGIFTAPLVVLMLLLALLLPGAFPDYPPRGPINGWVELHAALALVAYAAFALACITGCMYLLQERLIKRHRIGSLFYQLPPIQGLARAIARQVFLGLGLLSLSLLISLLKLNTPISNPKLLFSWGVWALYLLIALTIWRHSLSPRQTALAAALGFVIPFISLWIVTSHG